MTRIASKFGIAAALTLGMLSTAAAQTGTTKPTTTVGVAKGDVTTPVVRVDTVTRYIRDTVRMYVRDTIRVNVTGPTVTRWDTVNVVEVPGWLGRGNGTYFGLGAGPYYPSGGLGVAQIPGYAFQMNLGIDPAGSPLGVRLTAGLARPDESQPYATNRARPSIMNFTGDLKLRLPFLSTARFPNFGLYAVGGGAYIRAQDVGYDLEPNHTVATVETGSHDSWGYNAGAGATLSMGHKRELFLEARVINYSAGGTNYEKAHQLPIILGVNWY